MSLIDENQIPIKPSIFIDENRIPICLTDGNSIPIDKNQLESISHLQLPWESDSHLLTIVGSH